MSITLDHDYEPELTARFHRHLQPGDIVIDVGANMGYFTLLASALVGEHGLVIAFEPSQGNIRWLSLNLTINGISNVLMQSTALANETTLRRLSVPPVFNNGVSTLRESPNGCPTTPAWVQRFDELPFAREHSGQVALVKIDTEGLEVSVLKGMSALLASPNPRLAIACEISPDWYDACELLSILTDAGFSGEYYTDNRWLPLTRDSLPTHQCNAWFQRRTRD